VLEGLRAVRKRPGMYIGDVMRLCPSSPGVGSVDNAVDEHMAGYCKTSGSRALRTAQ
jgi:DNA gyrase subunit B